MVYRSEQGFIESQTVHDVPCAVLPASDLQLSSDATQCGVFMQDVPICPPPCLHLTHVSQLPPCNQTLLKLRPNTCRTESRLLPDLSAGNGVNE